MLARGHAAACVLSSDVPTLPTRLLVEAARILLAPGERAVLGACDDGGYYLLGLKRAHARLFADIAWSTDTVAAATRARARGTRPRSRRARALVRRRRRGRAGASRDRDRRLRGPGDPRRPGPSRAWCPKRVSA